MASTGRCTAAWGSRCQSGPSPWGACPAAATCGCPPPCEAGAASALPEGAEAVRHELDGDGGEDEPHHALQHRHSCLAQHALHPGGAAQDEVTAGEDEQHRE